MRTDDADIAVDIGPRCAFFAGTADACHMGEGIDTHWRLRYNARNVMMAIMKPDGA